MKSVVQAAAVLRFLGRSAERVGINAIARHVGLSQSSCFNVVKTLAAEDLVDFDPVSKTYALGFGTIELSLAALGRDVMLDLARPLMRRLAERFDAVIALWRITSRERLTLVALAESEAATRIHLEVGQRQPATAGATGRAVLAARRADPGLTRTAHEATRWQQQPSLEDFVAQVEQARACGWAVDVDQIIRGVTTVAAVVRDHKASPRFCLSASMFTGRDDAPRLNQIGSAIHEAARSLEPVIRLADAA